MMWATVVELWDAAQAQGTFYLVSQAGFLILVGGALALLPAFWSGKLHDRLMDNSAVHWPWSDALRMGVIRAFPATVGAGTGFAVVSVASVVRDAGTWESLASAALGIGAVLILSGVVLGISIVLLNEPHWLVPPHMRDQPGLLADQSRKGTRRN